MQTKTNMHDEDVGSILRPLVQNSIKPKKLHLLYEDTKLLYSNASLVTDTVTKFEVTPQQIVPFTHT